MDCKPTVFWQTHGFSKKNLRPGRAEAKIYKFLASLLYFHSIRAIKNDWKHQRWELVQCKVFPLSLANPRFYKPTVFWKSGCKPTVFTVKPWVEPTVKKTMTETHQAPTNAIRVDAIAGIFRCARRDFPHEIAFSGRFLKQLWRFGIRRGIYQAGTCS